MVRSELKMGKLKNHKLISAFFGTFYGVFGALGFFCLINWYTMTVFHERHRYPNLYPFCIVFGSYSLIYCIGALCGNICYICNRSRIKNEGEKGGLKWGIVVEAVAAILVFIICLVILDVLYGVVSSK